MTEINLDKGTVLCDTQVGHYNFHYPDTHKVYTLTHNVQAKMLNWIGTQNHKPLWVDEFNMVLWIKEEDLNATTTRSRRSRQSS